MLLRASLHTCLGITILLKTLLHANRVVRVRPRPISTRGARTRQITSVRSQDKLVRAEDHPEVHSKLHTVV
jgi:hypothetical protein